MQEIHDLSDISCITIREEMNATGEYADIGATNGVTRNYRKKL